MELNHCTQNCEHSDWPAIFEDKLFELRNQKHRTSDKKILGKHPNPYFLVSMIKRN